MTAAATTPTGLRVLVVLSTLLVWLRPGSSGPGNAI